MRAESPSPWRLFRTDRWFGDYRPGYVAVKAIEILKPYCPSSESRWAITSFAGDHDSESVVPQAVSGLSASAPGTPGRTRPAATEASTRLLGLCVDQLHPCSGRAPASADGGVSYDGLIWSVVIPVSGPPIITAIPTVGVPVTGQDCAVAFYIETLGLEKPSPSPSHSSADACWP
jgi:hypothetical protein